MPTNPIRVLHLEDTRVYRGLVRQLLPADRFLIVQASNQAEFEIALKQNTFDLVITDLDLPDTNGLAVLDLIRTKDPEIPVIMVTGTGSEELAVQAMRRGSWDYVIKSPRHIQRLPFAVAEALERRRLEREQARLQWELKEAHEQLRVLSRRSFEAQEAERRHLARELHDGLGQLLCAVGLALKSADLSRLVPAQRTRLENAITLVDDMVGQVRELALLLRPSVLDDFGLSAGLRWLVTNLTEAAGLRGTVSADEVHEDLPSEICTACFRVAQEAVSNAVRHAHATHVAITLCEVDAAVELTVCDDGCGFDVEATQTAARGGASMGILSMQERVRLLGGDFQIRSAPGSGTTIHCRFALASESEDRTPREGSG